MKLLLLDGFMASGRLAVIAGLGSREVKYIILSGASMGRGFGPQLQ